MKNMITFITDNSIGEYKENISFKTLTTYKTGGIAKLVVYPENITKLQELLKYIKNNNIDYKILGNGSNILASDNTYNGVIIKLDRLNKMTNDNGLIYVESGYKLVSLANEMCKEGYSGLEFACGIPGTLGGAIYMNAGAYLTDIGSVIKEVTVLDENYNIKKLLNKDLDLGYRHSIFMNKKYIIVSAIIKLEKDDIEEIKALINERKQRRQSTQPLEYPSAGSVFRNPKDMYAGKLIEDLGLKGFTIGGAKVSEKHANFIINYNNASSSDIKNVIEKIKKEVKENHNIDLHEEQEMFNWE